MAIWAWVCLYKMCIWGLIFIRKSLASTGAKNDPISFSTESVSNKVPIIVENLSCLLTSCRDDGIFLEALKANLEAGFSGKPEPLGQLGIWEMSLAAVQAFRGHKEEIEMADSILAMEKALLQVKTEVIITNALIIM